MAAFFAILPAFIAALPDIMKLAVEFVEWSKKNKHLMAMEDIEAQRDGLDKADTPEKKVDAARGFSGLMRKLTK